LLPDEEKLAMGMTRLLVMLGLGWLMVGCSSKYEGFTLPPGDAARGQAAFVHFRCYDCHRVVGVELPVGEEPNQAIVELGGKVGRVRTYEDLVTAIINPSHRLAQGYSPSLVAQDGKSRMTNYNEVMTVAQLIDLVTFLQGHHHLRIPEPTKYPNYYMP
jgi:sulfur-oxidizing protein SoxX